jgi:hypothetical protein
MFMKLYKATHPSHTRDTKAAQTSFHRHLSKEMEMKAAKYTFATLTLVTASLGAWAMGGPGGMMGQEGACDHPGGMMSRMHQGDPAKMQQRMQEHQAQRQTKLKEALKLTAAQEPAWTAFTEAMKPAMDMTKLRAQRDEMQKLTTPERIDRMQALHTEREAAMKKRAEATKTFYASLTAEQKIVFDQQAMSHHRGSEGRGMGKGPRPAAN